MNKTNLLLDIGILTAFLVAMEPRFSGIPIHEWLSIALTVAIIVHLLLHWKWIVDVGGRFFRKLWHTSRLKFVVDVLLFVGFIAVMLSGILISRSVLPGLGVQVNQASRMWRMLHSLSADLSILLVGLHFALSWDWVICTLKKYVVEPLARLVQPRHAAQPAPVQILVEEKF